MAMLLKCNLMVNLSLLCKPDLCLSESEERDSYLRGPKYAGVVEALKRTQLKLAAFTVDMQEAAHIM